MEAVDCSRKGLPHPRLNSIMDRTIDEMERRAAQRRQIVKGGIMSPTVEHDPNWMANMEPEKVYPKTK